MSTERPKSSAPDRCTRPATRRVVPVGLLVTVLAAPFSSAIAAVLTVGAPGTGCNHTNIQAAVNVANSTPGSDTIRVSRSAAWTAQQITINTNEEIHLVGGYATCGSPEPDGTATILSGAGGDPRPVLTIRGNGFVFLRNLTIRDGDQAGPDQGGGINFVGGGTLDIADTAIIENMAGYGGGIYADGSSITAEVLIRDNVTIGFNTARYNGGGLLVAGLEVAVMGTNSSILFNRALGEQGDSGYGGGALVISTNNFPSYLHLSAGGIGGVGALHANEAKHGGGLAIIGKVDSGRDAQARIFTRYANAPVRINGNTASGRGGAVYLASDEDVTSGNAIASAFLWGAYVDDNSAADGAAFYLNQDDSLFGIGGNSHVKFNPQPDMGEPNLPFPPGGLPCPNNDVCGSISRNSATSSTGAIIKHHEGGTFFGRRLLIQNNQGARLADTVLRHMLFNALITGNTTTQELFRQPDDGALWLVHVTVADNVIGAPQVLAVNDYVNLRNSFFWQPGKATLSAGANTVDVLYVLSNDISNLPVGPAAVAAPRFIDPNNGDYRLRAGSRGVDYAGADTTYAISSRETLDGKAHDIDVPYAGVTAPNRLADVGAYERPALQPLVLNSNFDTDLNLWSAMGMLAESSWDGTQNIAGSAGSGSVKVVYNTDPKDTTLAPLLAGRSQCVHLPGPGVYQLNGWGRVVPSSTPPMNLNRARLIWELRYNGSPLGCENGAPNLSGTHQLATTSTWNRPANAALIEVPAAVWTQNTSLTVRLDVDGGVINPPSAWFDGITLDILQNDIIFANGFQP